MKHIMIAAAIVLTLVVTSQASDVSADRSTVKRLPLTQQRFNSAVMTETAPGCYFIDFGKAYFAGLEIEIARPEPGRKVLVRMGEALAGPRSIDRTPQGSVRFHSAEITLKAGQTLYVVPLRAADGRLMPKEIGPVMPFRYVELENAPAVEARNIRQVAAFHPFNDAASDFRCPQADLVAVWDLCKHTMKATSFGGVFVDGDRERLPYEADAYINQLGWYSCTDDLTLPRYSHEHLIQHPTWPTEWILFSVLMAWEDYRYTGDPASMKMFYEDLKAKTLIDLARQDGLISTVQPPFPKDEFAKRVGGAIHINNIRDIVDWPAGERDGNRLPAVNTVVNAFHCLALRRMADIAAVLRKPEDEKRFREAAARVLQSLNTKLIDPATGLYVDGEGDTHSSLHANMFPLAFGLVPAERREKVAAFVKSRGMACSVYGAQFLMEALFNAGLADHALALMTADGDRSWTHMVKRVGTTITLEAWDTKYKRNQDWNHAWGAAPANILPRKVLGVEPLEPGFAKVLVQPRPGSLAWAEGRVPTRHGPVTVRFDQDDRSFKLRLEVPQGTMACIGVPKGKGGTLTLDGKPVKSTEADGYLFIDHVAAGPHELLRSSE